MENEIAVWRLPADENSPVEKIVFYPTPLFLDDATQQLPGGAYTTLRTFGRFRVLRLEDHFNRLKDTARLAGKPVQIDCARLRQMLHKTFSSYPQENMRARIILDLEKQPGTIYVLIEALHTPPPAAYEHGVKAVTRHLQRENPKAKLTGFIETAAEVRQKLPVGVNEAIMVGEDGRMLEGLSSNFFAVKDWVIWTAEQGVLSGITRSLVLEVIKELGLPLKLEGLKAADLREVEEAFITSASRAVLPVTEIDGKAVVSGTPGPVTEKIMKGYEERLEKELETVG